MAAAIFFAVALFLHFAWEMWQIPFYRNMTDATHGEVVWLCTRAALGDAVMALIAYSVAAIMARRMDWFMMIETGPALVYFATGLLLTVLLEYRATVITGAWAYSEWMPRIPVTNTGIVPLVQWLVLPLVTLGVARVYWRGLA